MEDDSKYFKSYTPDILDNDVSNRLYCYEYVTKPYTQISMASYSKGSDVYNSIHELNIPHVFRKYDAYTVWANKPYSLKYIHMMELMGTWG